MKIEITEDEARALKRLQELYYDQMYRDLYEKSGSEFPCDKYCENFMKSSIEDIVVKITVNEKSNTH